MARTAIVASDLSSMLIETSNPKITDLPFEILDAVCEPLERVQALHRLNQTCSKLHTYVQKRGWSNFLRDRLYISDRFTRNHFPVDALRGMTAVSRDLDRRSFHARRLVEPADIYNTPVELSIRGQNIPQRHAGRGGRAGRGGHMGSARRGLAGGPFAPHPYPTTNQHYPGVDRQSIGYSPPIDSYEYTGWQWTSRKEVVAWGAGSKLLLRQVYKGQNALRLWVGAEDPESESPDRDEYYHRWFSYEKPGSVQGADDITSLNVLDNAHNSEPNEHVIVGRASGGLHQLSLNPKMREWTEKAFESNKTLTNRVKCTSVGKVGEEVLLSAAFADKSISLYMVDLQHRPSAISTTDPLDAAIWCSSLSANRLAVGCGPSPTPMKILEITPHGILKEPVRSFRAAEPQSDSQRLRAVNAIIPSTNAPILGGGPGDLFFVGCHDGDCLLLDTRSSRDYVGRYTDPIHTSSIYSLALLGGQRLLAGSSRHSLLKFFDLRMPGKASCYFSQPGRPELGCPDRRVTGPSDNYSLFLDTDRRPASRGVRRHPHQQQDSSVYSLSVPSITSPTVYAGVQGRVIQLDAAPSSTRVPEPMNVPQQHGSLPDHMHASLSYQSHPRNDPVDIKMVDHGSGLLYRHDGYPKSRESQDLLHGFDAVWSSEN